MNILKKLAAAGFLCASISSSMAVEGLQISVQCSNVVLAWPTIDGSGATYMIRRRADLSTNSSWQVIADFYPAATGTNVTAYTDVGVVSNAICGDGAGPLMLTQNSSQSQRAAMSPASLPLPPLPPGLAYFTNADGAVSVIVLPLNELKALNMRSIPADGSQLPPFPLGDGDGSGGSNTVATSYAFYEVVKDGITLYGLTNGSTISGVLQFPAEAANASGQLMTLALEDGGSAIAASILSAPYERPVPMLTLDTTQLTNGVHYLSAYGQWTDPGDGTEEGTSVYEAISDTFSVTVSNEICFPDWMPQFGELGDSLAISAMSAHTNVQFFIDFYDSQFDYIGTMDGTTTNGNINVVWNLIGPYGEYYPDSTFEFVVYTSYGAAVAPPTYRQTDPWLGPGDWVVVNQQAWDNLLGSDELDTMTDGFVTIGHGLGLTVRPNTGNGSAYRLRFGTGDPNADADWANFRAALYDPLSRNLFYLGHGTPDGLGYDQTTTNRSILATEIATNLVTLPGATNSHKFRFVCLDGCSTATGKLPEAFGIIHKPNVSTTSYYNSSIRPSAFVGWDNDQAAGFSGSINTSHVYFWQHFQFGWSANGYGVQQAIVNAGNYPDDTFIQTNHINVFGCWSLTVNAFNQ